MDHVLRSCLQKTDEREVVMIQDGVHITRSLKRAVIKDNTRKSRKHLLINCIINANTMILSPET